MGLLRSVAAVVLILAALSACGGGEGAASDGVLHGNSGTTTSSGGARLLFSSGFESSTVLNAPSNFYGTGAHQTFVGTDGTTGFTWPGNIWGGSIDFLMITGVTVNASTLGNYMVNRIETVTGHNGNPTQSPLQRTQAEGRRRTQDVLMLQPAREEGDMYISFWLKLQPDLLAKMTPQTWSSIFEWKTGGDYRTILYVASWEDGCRGVKPNGPLFWQLRGDNEANGGLPYQEFWKVDNCSHAVPVGQWFKLEVFWHRSHQSDGRTWVAVNGTVIFDHYGANYGVNNATVNRIMLPNLYSDPSSWPIYHWVDDVEIWNGFPPVGNNPPYAPH